MTQQGQEDVVAQLRDLSRHPRYHGVTWTSSEAAICGAAADEIDCLRTLLSSSRGEQGWRTIDSAPKDGTYIILGNAQGAWVGCYVARYQSGYVPEEPWHSMMMNRRHMPRYSSAEPTHWMPLPSAPGSVPTSLAGQGTDGTEGDADLCDDCGSALGPGEGGDHGEPNRCDACNVTRREIDRPVTDPTDGGADV